MAWSGLFNRFSAAVAHWAGKPAAFLFATAVVTAWALSGPVFGFSDTWQLVINTGTTIVTFLMVFVIQNTQNRDGIAIQTKLDELIRALETAENRYIGIEHLREDEVERLRDDFERANRAVEGREPEPDEQDRPKTAAPRAVTG